MPRCKWFTRCTNVATTTRDSFLGEVPCCARCAALVDKLSSPRTDIEAR